MSRASIAARTGLAENRVSAIAKGRQHVEAYVVLVRICEGLGIPRELMGVSSTSGDGGNNASRRIAMCGSRRDDTDPAVIEAAVCALARLFKDRFDIALQHGPRGIGIEVVTHIANHYRPSHLHKAVGLFGHANVVRGVSAAIVVGGGQGTHDELDLAIAAGIPLLPIAASGGAAQRIYTRLKREDDLRKWINDRDFASLGSCGDTESIMAIVGRLIDEESLGGHRA